MCLSKNPSLLYNFEWNSRVLVFSLSFRRLPVWPNAAVVVHNFTWLLCERVLFPPAETTVLSFANTTFLHG